MDILNRARYGVEAFLEAIENYSGKDFRFSIIEEGYNDPVFKFGNENLDYGMLIGLCLDVIISKGYDVLTAVECSRKTLNRSNVISGAGVDIEPPSFTTCSFGNVDDTEKLIQLIAIGASPATNRNLVASCASLLAPVSACSSNFLIPCFPAV